MWSPTNPWVRRIVTAAFLSIATTAIVLFAAIVWEGPISQPYRWIVERDPRLLMRIGGFTLMVFVVLVVVSFFNERASPGRRDPS